MKTRFSPARCCCDNECYATFIVRDKCTGDPIATGARVALYTKDDPPVLVALSHSGAGGLVHMDLPGGPGTFDIGAYWNCAEVFDRGLMNAGVEITCSTRDYEVEAWDDATTGDQYIQVISVPYQGYPPDRAPCRGTFAGWEIMIDGVKHVFEEFDEAKEGQPPSLVYRTKWKADVYGKICGTVSAEVDCPFPYEQVGNQTATFRPGCSFLDSVVSIRLIDGFACCAYDDDFPTGGYFYNDLQLTNDLDTWAIAGTICGGSDYRVVTAPHSCVQPYLTPIYDAPSGVGTNDVHVKYQWGWNISRGGWYCDQLVAEFCWVWSAPPGPFGRPDVYRQRLRWRNFNNQPVTSEQLEAHWVAYPATSYAINSDNYPSSITFYWDQVGDWTKSTNAPCPDGEPVSTFLDLTERSIGA